MRSLNTTGLKKLVADECMFLYMEMRIRTLNTAAIKYK